MGKILVVDDESSIRDLFVKIFNKKGHTTLSVSQGNDVFNVIRTEKPDLIIMDVTMPGERGLSLLRSMPNQKENRIPAIIFSGYLTPVLEKEAYKLGAADVIEKGTNMDQLCASVEKILAQKNGATENTENQENKNAILIVDDESTIRSLLANFLNTVGFETIEAETGEEAIKLIEGKAPALALIDINMPGMDGAQTLQKIRTTNPKIGTIMITGVQDNDLALQCINLGAYDYLTKPFDLNHVHSVIEAYFIMTP